MSALAYLQTAAVYSWNSQKMIRMTTWRDAQPYVSSLSTLLDNDPQISKFMDNLGATFDIQRFDVSFHSFRYICLSPDQINSVWHPLTDISPAHCNQLNASFHWPDLNCLHSYSPVTSMPHFSAVRVIRSVGMVGAKSSAVMWCTDQDLGRAPRS